MPSVLLPRALIGAMRRVPWGFRVRTTVAAGPLHMCDGGHACNGLLIGNTALPVGSSAVTAVRGHVPRTYIVGAERRPLSERVCAAQGGPSRDSRKVGMKDDLQDRGETGRAHQPRLFPLGAVECHPGYIPGVLFPR